jgi:hypothetical protein
VLNKYGTDGGCREIVAPVVNTHVVTHMAAYGYTVPASSGINPASLYCIYVILPSFGSE